MALVSRSASNTTTGAVTGGCKSQALRRGSSISDQPAWINLQACLISARVGKYGISICGRPMPLIVQRTPDVRSNALRCRTYPRSSRGLACDPGATGAVVFVALAPAEGGTASWWAIADSWRSCFLVVADLRACCCLRWHCFAVAAHKKPAPRSQATRRGPIAAATSRKTVR